MDEILVSQSDFELIVAMPDNIKFERLYHSIIKAQRRYLAGFLGNALYYALYTNQTSSPYVDLLNGTGYQKGGKTEIFYGLRYAIVSYAYAVFLDDNRIRVTRTGNKVKKSEYSEQATKQEIDAEIRKNLSEGAKYLYNAKDFLEARQSDYPDFLNGHIFGGTTISSVGHPRYKGNGAKRYGADGRMLSWNNENY